MQSQDNSYYCNRTNLKSSAYLQQETLAEFFGSSSPFRKVDNIRGYKDPKVKAYYRRKGEFTDFNEYSKGGKGSNRKLENLRKKKGFSIDVDSGIPLYFQELLAELNRYEIIKPNWIARTSPNHYQLIYEFPRMIVDDDMLEMFKAVQLALFKILEKFGADPNSLGPVQIFRNPYFEGADIVYSSDHKVTLGELYRSLKEAGFIDAGYKKWRTKFHPEYIPLEVSRKKLREFFKRNETATYNDKEFAGLLNMAVDTFKKLTEEFENQGLIETRFTGRWEERKTCYASKIFEAYIKHKKHRALVLSDRGGVYSGLLRLFFGGSVPVGCRDSFVFYLSLWFKCMGRSQEWALEFFESRFFCFAEGGDIPFTLKQCRKCVQSSFRDRYLFYANPKRNRDFQKFLVKIGVLNLELESLPVLSIHSECCDCNLCVPDCDLSFNFGEKGIFNCERQ